MRIYATSVMVDDQEKARAFYTEKLGFIVKTDVPAGPYRWLTLVPKEAPDGTELLLEPNAHPAAKTFQKAIRDDGIPATAFQVTDLDGEYKALKDAGVTFTKEPMDAGTVRIAILDDTCGNLIQLVEMKDTPA